VEWSLVLAAAVIAADGVSCLLVGNAALWLHGEPVAVRDVDLVIEPGEANLQRLRDVLTRIALRPRAIPSARVAGLAAHGRRHHVLWKVDCLLERGRLGWEQLSRSATTIRVADSGVLVASPDDAWALRRWFKEQAE
jgi:hypothetical protein